jgi:hypothetical protein
MTSSAAESDYLNLHNARLPVAVFQTHLNVWEAKFCSDDCSFTNRFLGTVRAEDPSGHGCAFSSGEELRRISRRKEASICQPYRILQTLGPDRGCAGSQHLHFLVACTGRRLKYYRSASECSFTKRGSPKVGVPGISGNVCTVTVQQIGQS